MPRVLFLTVSDGFGFYCIKNLYYIKISDHLGNTVVLFKDKNENGIIEETNNPETSEVLQRNLYYPFGLALEGTWNTSTTPNMDYLYNGKELADDVGLDWQFYGFRMYDPAVGRFTGVDPIADQFAFVSTFNYAENNPIFGVDLHGLQFVPFTMVDAWWSVKKVQWKNSINSGFSDMHQGATRSNPQINNAPLSQKGKDFMHLAQTNNGMAKTLLPTLEAVNTLSQMHPFGAATNGFLHSASETHKGNYSEAALSAFFYPS